MKQPDQPTSSFTRRLLLQATAAFCALRFTDCGAGPVSLQTSETGKGEKEFVDQGNRIYGIVPADEAIFNADVLPNIKPAPMHISSYQTWSRRQLEETEAAPPALQWMIWGQKSDAERIANMEGVKEVIEKQPEHVLETGSPDHANGTLSILFAVPPTNHIDKTAASLGQIKLTLQKAASEIEGVTVKHLPRKETPPDKIGEFPVEQITIEFTTESLNAEFLKLIKEHVQAIHLKWDGLFTEFFCPPCGLG